MSARPIHLLKNLGPVSARALAEVGIADEEQLRAVGAATAFRRWRHISPRVSLNALWALAGAVENRDCRSFSAEERAALKRAAGVD